MSLTKLEFRIREYLLYEPDFITIADLAADLDVTLSTINPSLKRLWRRGYIALLNERPEPKPEQQKIRWAKRRYEI